MSQPIIMSSLETCTKCKFSRVPPPGVAPDNFRMCFGMPPQVAVIVGPGPNGQPAPIMQVNRPIVGGTDPACSLYKPAILAC